MSKAILEEVPCNLCGGAEHRPFYEGMDNRYVETPREKFRLVRCRQCGLVYLNPRPTAESLGLFYPSNYTPYHQKVVTEAPRLKGIRGLNERIWQWIAERKDKEKLSLLTRLHRRPGRVLDVGCATGHFLACMQQIGWQVAGVELNAEAAARARSALGVEIHVGNLLSCPWPDASFDVVTMWHVLEHVPDPHAVLQNIARLLRPGGRIVILVPNARSAEFWLLGGLDQHPIDIPRHLYHFSPSTLARLFQQAGFERERVETFTWNTSPRLTVVVQSLIQQWQPHYSVSRTIRGMAMLSVWGIGMATAAILGLASAGPAFIMVGRKPALGKEDGCS